MNDQFRRRNLAQRAVLLLLALALATLPVASFGFALKGQTEAARPAPPASSADATRVTSTVGLAESGSPSSVGRAVVVAGAGASGAPGAPLIAQSARGTFVPGAEADAGQIVLGSRFRFDPLRQGEPPVRAGLAAAPPGPGERASYLVQLRGAAMPGQRDQIEAAGARIFAYVPHHAFLARMTPEERDAVAALSFVRWVGLYQPAYKIADQLETGSGAATLVVLLFPDADLDAERAALVAMGGTVEEATDSGRNKILRASVDVSRVAAIAARNGVAWVELWRPRTIENALAQWVLQTNVTNLRRIWDMGLHGEGQVVHTSDSGIRSSHNAFRDDAVPINTFGEYPTHRKIIAYKQATAGVPFGDHQGASHHGTHTAGTVAGDDSPFANDARDGQAYKAKLYFTDAGGNSTSIIIPTDMNLTFGPAYAGNAGGAARISSNSWGSPVNEYDVQSMTVDQFMWDHKDFLVFFSNGNSAGPGTVGSPAGNKNGVGAGASQNGANAGIKASFSSEGPTSDGRTKPTLMAPGDGVTPLSGVQSANGANDTGYKGLSGTSMASPGAAGATALIRQYLTEGWYPTGTPTPEHALAPSAALLKAIAISSTDNDMTGHNVPDFTIGWGRIKLDNVLYFPGDAVRTALVDQLNGLATGEFVEYQVRVTDSAVPLKITLCWTDREALPGAGVKLINDLNLTVMDPDGVVYVGNVFAGGQSQPAGARDQLNVEEGVRRDAPLAGVWTIRVTGWNVPFAPQPFALAITGGVGGTSGIVRLDRQTYGRSDVIHVRVEDLNATAPVQVLVSSPSEPFAETVALTGAGGVYTGTIPTTALAAVGADGTISVSHGDLITVSYFDQDPVGGGSSATATADFDGPAITEVRAVDEGAHHDIRWTTDVLSTSQVHYGATPSLGQTSTLDPGLGTFHAVPLTGLEPETQYWFDVESSDHGGNATRDDNGGQHYRFATGKSGEILVVIGDGSFTNDALYVSALRDRGWAPSLLKGGTIQNPPLGDRQSGLRSKIAVWWQVGLEQYPPFEDAARDVVTQYLDGGGRLVVSGHDIAWAFTDAASGHHTPARAAWLESTLRLRFLEDPLAWASNHGIAGDPISDAYQAGVPYTPHRAGAAGDEVEIVPGTGTGSYVWRNTDATPGNIGTRWESDVPNGDPASAVWGGQPSRLVYNGFEWSGIADPIARTDILDKALIWLIGRDHPDATVQSPNGGEVFTGDQVTISWTEASHGGAVASRSLFYSGDGGSSWNLIAAGVAASPIVWDLSGLPNGTRYRVRVEVGDDGDPALIGRDASDADFTLNRPGGDTQGPVVVAGSIRMSPNPINNQSTATLTATLTDVGHGDANITQAEFSWGDDPAAPGDGFAMSGGFDSPTVAVSGTVPAHRVPVGQRKFWVRGRDAGGTWGSATAQTFVVNGDPTVDVGEALPLAFALEQSFPNPARGGTNIRFALPRPAKVELAVFGLRGERVRTLVSGPQPAGHRNAIWDGRSEAGRPVPSGVYFYRLVTEGFEAKRKLIVLR